MERDLTRSETEPSIDIRLCTEGDMPVVSNILDHRVLQERFRAQQAGESSLVIAWHLVVPVGHLDLKWHGNEQPEVRRYVRDCPELSTVGVWPPEMRSHGIGRKLIDAAEGMIESKGFTQVGLAVEVDNNRAKQLYERMGYQDWGHGICYDRWTEIDGQGNGIPHNDPCNYLIKTL